MSALPYAEALWLGGPIATLAPAGDDPWGLLPDGAIAVSDGRIVWVGAASELPGGFTAAEVHDLGGRWLLPGLIDCHTHLVWAGSRVEEYERRLAGASYEDIARAGGGILATVQATRAADAGALYAAAAARLADLCADGVTTVEIKSGYGLDVGTERRQLEVARRLGQEQPVNVYTSFLGAHVVPPEYSGRAGLWIAFLADELLPMLAADGLVDAVDAYCEPFAYTPSHCETLFAAARALGLPVRVHAEQRSRSGGARVAARFAARSADHLEYADESDIAALAAAGTVAVLLPGAFLMLGERQLPPLAALRRHGVPIALASDLNPGTSPLRSPRLAAALGCQLWGLTPAEAIAGLTRHAARALGLAATHGTLEPGKIADFSIWKVEHPAELAYWLGGQICTGRVLAGRPVAAEADRCLSIPSTT